MLPAGAGIVSKLSPAFDRLPRAMSHDVSNFEVPTGLNWNEHSAGSATTTTGDCRCAVSSAGFT